MEQLKILVVDDEARMRKLVKDFLSVKGFTVLEASNGEEAVDLFFLSLIHIFGEDRAFPILTICS